ncbi:hypothetical protein PQX77_001241 [Marasmius sp. AFHP31]|nr:hypothetical protein PQX77_001241 [Marasmius sp. AFHP31]
MGSSFSHVNRDQYNYNGPTTIIQKRKKKWTEFDEAERTICTAKVMEQPGKMFTVMEYSGPEARKAGHAWLFEEDFQKFSQASTSNIWQMYGYNDSNVPLLISYNELVPVAHLWGNIRELCVVFLSSLARQLGCEREELWVDGGRGVICRGPPGPIPHYGYPDFGIKDLPLTAELQEDVLLRFFSSLESKEADHAIVTGVASSGAFFDTPNKCVCQLTVFSTSTNTLIAFANNVWKGESGLSDQHSLENGLTRFTLTCGSNWFGLECNIEAKKAWISQAGSIFHTLGISMEEDLSTYEFVYHYAELHGNLSDSEAQHKQRSQQPIYIFVRLSPLDFPRGKTSSVHFWSFDEDGQFPLPHNVCSDLGLPIQLEFYTSPASQYSWSNDNYKIIHQYQHLRGFNYTTTNFAQYLGYNKHIFQPVNHLDRFTEVSQEARHHTSHFPDNINDASTSLKLSGSVANSSARVVVLALRESRSAKLVKQLRLELTLSQ